MKDQIMTRIDRPTYKKLQQIKIDYDIKTINDAISFAVKCLEENKK